MKTIINCVLLAVAPFVLGFLLVVLAFLFHSRGLMDAGLALWVTGMFPLWWVIIIPVIGIMLIRAALKGTKVAP